MDKLGHMQGMGGLFVAAVYGGVLSSMSSQANSIACIIWEDFLKDQPYFKTFSNTAATNTVKLLSAVTGILSVGCGLLSGQLGSLFNVAYSINGALKGPLDGVFLTGILVPWANKKGALAGLIISSTFNMWLVIGKFIQGGGTPPYLPLSTEGCLVNGSHPLLINSTTAYSFPNSPTTTVPSSYTSTGINPVASTHNPQIEAIDVSSTSHTIYDISYCYSGIMGVIITMVISSLVSLCTGPVAPKNVNKKLVNLTCARLHHQLWQLLPNHDSYSNDMEDKVAPNLTTSASTGLDDVQQLTKKQTGSREDYPNL
ncbi:Sodium-coupled monocarboxylate transporter 1-like 2 [Homarus americanus]|uniref:Sodium-coupled monocarboxylate transporter 1-like 2 n=2 Tax=Homarus americanus TaxID=6706 RepID=A0A8J5MFU9_HOMAM|nr:Sodium-coupled monocarboxylate transporter 1-like 2 [Homarus americanus]